MDTGQHDNTDAGVPGSGGEGTRVGCTPVFPIPPSTLSTIQITEKEGYIPPATGMTPTGTAESPDVEWLPELPDRLAEPFAAVIPAIGHRRLVHLTVAPKTPCVRFRSQRSPGSPAPFTLATGEKVPHLPPYDHTIARVTSVDVDLVAKDHPEYAVASFVRQFGIEEFVLQVERARAYLRGPAFWKMKPIRTGYAGYGLKHGAEKLAGEYAGYVSEMALIVAAILDGLKTKPYSKGEQVVVFR